MAECVACHPSANPEQNRQNGSILAQLANALLNDHQGMFDWERRQRQFDVQQTHHARGDLKIFDASATQSCRRQSQHMPIRVWLPNLWHGASTDPVPFLAADLDTGTDVARESCS